MAPVIDGQTLRDGIELLKALAGGGTLPPAYSFVEALTEAWYERAAADRAPRPDSVIGLTIELPATELQVALEERATHHTQRAGFYREQARINEDLDDDPGFPGANTRPMPAAQQARMSMREHERKAAYFRFMADHVIAGQIYRLSEADLTRLEVLDRYL